MARAPASGEARDAARRQAWPEVHRLLHDQDAAALDAPDLEALADAAWWLSRVEESLAVRQRAHAAYAAAGDARRAGYNAWMLSTEYGLIGRTGVAAGWLRKAQRHLRDEPDCVERGFLAYGEVEVAEAAGDLDEARRLAAWIVDIGSRCDSPDLVAMGRQVEARLLIADDRVADGLALLDEVMTDVMTGGLGDMVTGWLYCLAVPICFDLADLRRASEWNDAAMAWCDTLPAGTPFHGLCRVHHVELLGLGGAWEDADAEADRACDELLAYHPSLAAESFYVAGEIRRRRGDMGGAEQAFLRAHELGREPQPGLALLRLAQGKGDAAAAALRSCLADGTLRALDRARLLAAQVEVTLAVGDPEAARAAAHELAAGAGPDTALLEAMAASAAGAVAAAEHDVTEALARLRRARSLWLELGLPYEAAQVRVRLATASRDAGDDDTARLELQAARSVFERLGSRADVRRVDALLAGDRATVPGGLTRRELEVLRLVAAGRTNRDIATELVISQHTVSRHLNNIFAKLGVSSRAAATSFAHTHGLV